jgi:Family of unknown function (DUF6118)
LAWTGGAAFIVGLLISPVFARVLPFGWDGHVAAFIMNADRWNAGTELMQAHHPEAWRDLESAAALLRPNIGVGGLPRGGGEIEERTALRHRGAGAVTGNDNPRRRR